VANRLAREADVILALGTRMPEMDCSSWKRQHFFHIPPAKLIQVDINPNEIGKIYPVEVGIVGDARLALQQLLDAAKADLPARQPSGWVKSMQSEREKWWNELRTDQQSDDAPISVGRLLGDIAQVLPQDGIFVSGVGVRHAAGQHILFQRPMTHIVASGHGTMGQEVPAALGAKLGRPDVPVIAAVGDGAFRSTMQSVLPAVEYGINVVWVVQNNYSFNIISLYQKRHWERMIGTEFTIEAEGKPYNPDFAELARACGACGTRVERPEDLKPALEEAIAANRPYVLDVIMTQKPRSRASGYWVVNDILSPAWSGEPIQVVGYGRGARSAARDEIVLADGQRAGIDQMRERGQIAVIGAGTMGDGIAQLFAVAGFQSAPGLPRASLARRPAKVSSSGRRAGMTTRSSAATRVSLSC